jgi:hypothetical protein
MSCWNDWRLAKDQHHLLFKIAKYLAFIAFLSRRGTFNGQNATFNARRETGDARRATRSGHRETFNVRREGDNGQNGTANGRRETDSSHRASDSARRETCNGRRASDSVRREVASGRRETGDFRRCISTAEFFPAIFLHREPCERRERENRFSVSHGSGISRSSSSLFLRVAGKLFLQFGDAGFDSIGAKW